MRIAVVGPTYPFRGGISHYNTLLCEHLQKHHEVRLFTFRRQYPRWLFPGRDDRDPSERPLQTSNTPMLDPINPLSWWQTARQVVAIKSDLLILHWWVTFWALPFATIAQIVRRQGVPVVYLCHNVLPHEEKLWDRVLARLALSQGSRFIVMAKAEERRLKALLPGAIVHQIFLPSYAALAEVERPLLPQEARRRLNLDPARPVALFFGFVRAYKGLRFLLEAMPKVLAQIEIYLLIVGEFWEDKQEYLELISHLGVGKAVTIVDRYVTNEEMAVYFSAADVVVLPYIDVTQSAVVQLAYGFGKPVITTTIGDLPDVVEHQQTGLIVPPANPAALATALKHFFCQGLHQPMREAILSRQDKFSWTHLEGLLDKIVNEATE